MILGTHVALCPLVVCRRSLINVLSCLIGPHKGNCLDVFVVTKKIHSSPGAMDHVENTRRKTNITSHLPKLHSCQRHTFRRLHQKGVASCVRHGEHPKRDHRWKVERTDASTDAKWNTIRMDINCICDP